MPRHHANNWSSSTDKPKKPNTASKYLIGPNRRAWLSMRSFVANLWIGDYQKDDDEEHVDEDPYDHQKVYLYITVGKNKQQFIPLSSLTKEELLAMREFFDAAFTAALPVCESLDEFAQQEMDQGAVMLAPRLFRSAPVLVVRNLDARTVRGRTPTDNKENSNDNEDPTEAERRAWLDDQSNGE